MLRFTVRDLLWLMVVVGITLSGFANARQIATLHEQWSNNVWNEIVTTGRPPLTGRDAIQP